MTHRHKVDAASPISAHPGVNTAIGHTVSSLAEFIQ
jgi:hypothetical protein